ncbi:MAG TPA: AAA family ATPase [Pirellulales bacterium]|nr:AAA family ATPase [Pirellulales bacterium]
MRVQQGDTVIRLDDPRVVGVVERRSGDTLTIRLPEDANRREQVNRDEVRPLAEAMLEARKRGTKFRNDLSLTGMKSTLAELVAAFGYATERLRQESLRAVRKQLERAGLEVRPSTDRWGRDDFFSLVVRDDVPTDSPESNPAEAATRTPVEVILPDPFWPSAMGLEANREIAFLRALTAHDPLLCLLHVPDDSATQRWLQPTFEGMASWAYRAAQGFGRTSHFADRAPKVIVGPAAMLQMYLTGSVLSAEALQLCDEPHHMNLVALKKDSDSPVDSARLRAIWPGPIFDFRPQPPLQKDGRLPAEVKSILECLFLLGGQPKGADSDISPITTLLWSKDAYPHLLARSAGNLGRLLSSEGPSKFKGSNESGTALAIKSQLAHWIKATQPDSKVAFEEISVEELDEYGDVKKVSRTDVVNGRDRYEVETLLGSGPMEAFYAQKVFARLKRKNDDTFNLVVPSEAVLWAGPYLADLAHHLGSRGHVLAPGAGDTFLQFRPKALCEQPPDDLPGPAGSGIDPPTVIAPVDPRIKLAQVAGYKTVRKQIADDIIWPETHRRAIRRSSRCSGILFFGPPGCGKSLLARAIAGELDHDVRLLSPSDLRGVYIGWGQIMIREQFDWVAENERRMLVIDELDAVARSRREQFDMHSDEKASVNELLVQLDRVSRLGRLVVGTTNYVDSLDDAVIRSGRFGSFVPVPPPTLDDSVEILDHYLSELLAEQDTNQSQPRIQIPTADAIRDVLKPRFSESLREGRFYCGADLEEAVNRTHRRCLRDAIEAMPETASRQVGNYSDVAVVVSVEELGRSLQGVRRSVSREAVDQFISDVKRFCPTTVADEMEERFGDGVPQGLRSGKRELIVQLHASFEASLQRDEDSGTEFWLARDLQGDPSKEFSGSRIAQHLDDASR